LATPGWTKGTGGERANSENEIGLGVWPRLPTAANHGHPRGPFPALESPFVWGCQSSRSQPCSRLVCHGRAVPRSTGSEGGREGLLFSGRPAGEKRRHRARQAQPGGGPGPPTPAAARACGPRACVRDGRMGGWVVTKSPRLEGEAREEPGRRQARGKTGIPSGQCLRSPARLFMLWEEAPGKPA